MPILNSCFRFLSLKTGTICTGATAIVLAAVTLIVLFTTNIKFKTIAMLEMSSSTVKILLGFNLLKTIILSLLLIIGAIKRNRWLMLPWVILAILLAVASAFTVIYMAVEFYLDGEALWGTIWLIFGLISTAIFIYLWLVVYSYFQLILEEKNRGPYSRPIHKYYG